MNRIIGPLWLTSLLAVTTLLSGCSAKLTTGTAGADEAAVRQTLAEVEQRINQGDLGFVDVFAKDAIIIAPSVPDIVGYGAIRAMYAGLMEKTSMNLHFSTEEVAVAGDLAYEHGTYTLKMIDKASGQTLQNVKNKHVHIMKRQPDGSWKTWRMMVASAEPAPSNK
jgi:uncharacterized protein (TIGR02246 family)